MTDNKRKCFKCGSTNTDPDVVLYRFPRPGVKNMLRCELWAKYSFPDRPWSSPDFQKKLFSEHRMLCHKHFKESSFIDFSIKKLHRHAAPDIECDKTLRQCFNAGLKVSATVCDMGGTNQRALKSLGATESNPVIKIDDKEVIALFDAPHLLKCFRNMFMKYDIKCKTNISSGETSGEGLAKWSHIKQFYEIDKCNPNFVFAPSLTKEHLEPNAKQKMKVNLAAQIFSHTVAAGMFSKVAEGQLPAAAAVTATVLSKMDKLFDLLNSDTQDLRGGKPYATNMSEKSPHKPYFEEMIIFFNPCHSLVVLVNLHRLKDGCGH